MALDHLMIVGWVPPTNIQIFLHLPPWGFGARGIIDPKIQFFAFIFRNMDFI